MRAVRVMVFGRVQGVGYRANCQRQALQQGLVGWVRNRADGRVEAVAQGPADAVERWLAWCNRGSAAARVDRVDVQEEPVDQDRTGFDVHPTA